MGREREDGEGKRGEGWEAIRQSVTEAGGRGVYSHTLYLPDHWDVTGNVTAPPPTPTPPGLTYEPSHRGTTIRPERDGHFLEQMLAFPVKSDPCPASEVKVCVALPLNELTGS